MSNRNHAAHAYVEGSYVMPRRNGKKTRETKTIEEILKEHFPGYPKDYPPLAFRFSPESIRVRLVHDSFRGKTLSDRDDLVTPVIRKLPPKTQADITMLLLFSPNEVDKPIVNLDF
jgi:hypothetical protein